MDIIDPAFTRLTYSTKPFFVCELTEATGLSEKLSVFSVLISKYMYKQ